MCQHAKAMLGKVLRCWAGPMPMPDIDSMVIEGVANNSKAAATILKGPGQLGDNFEIDFEHSNRLFVTTVLGGVKPFMQLWIFLKGCPKLMLRQICQRKLEVFVKLPPNMSMSLKMCFRRSPLTHYLNNNPGTMPSNSFQIRSQRIVKCTHCHQMNKFSLMNSFLKISRLVEFALWNPPWLPQCFLSRRKMAAFAWYKIIMLWMP